MTATRAPRLLAKAWIIGLLCYIAWRAFTLSLTCDEAWSAEPLPYPGLFGFITPAFIAGLNVHLLNSWLINLGMTLFGEHDFVVRLPALAGGACYLIAAYRLSARLLRPWAALAAVILLTANPYLLDFFSIGRGYALGLGCLMLGLDRLLLPRPGKAPWHLAWFALATLANLSFLYAYLTALAIETARALPWPPYRSRPTLTKVRALLQPALVTLAGLGLTYGQAMRIATKHHEYWWGSLDGFVAGSLASLARVTLYRENIDPALPLLLTRIVLGIMAALFLAALAARLRSGRACPAWQPFLTLLAFFGIVWAGLTLEHALFHTPYLIERGLFFLYPVLALSLVCGTQCLPTGKLPAFTARGLTAALCLVMLYNFARAANVSYTFTWRGDACSRPFMEQIARENYPRNFTRQTIKLVVDNMNVHTADYYIKHLRLCYIDKVSGLDGLDEAAYAIVSNDVAKKPDIAGRFTAIMRCPANGLVLLRRK